MKDVLIEQGCEPPLSSDARRCGSPNIMEVQVVTIIRAKCLTNPTEERDDDGLLAMHFSRWSLFELTVPEAELLDEPVEERRKVAA